MTKSMQSITRIFTTSKEAEDQYRQFYFRADIAQSKAIILLLAIVVAIFGFSDYLFLGLSLEFYSLEALRLAVIAYSILLIVWLGRVKNYHAYDRSLFLYLFVFVIFSLLVNATRLHSFGVHAVIVGASVFLFYLAFSTRFANQTLLSLVYTAGEIALLLVAQTPVNPEVFTILISLVFINIIAAVGSWYLHAYRWQIFQEFNERKKSERLAAIGQVAGMVGHDVRNPLQAITSELYLAKTELEELPKSPQKEALNESVGFIEKQIAYIDKIVKDLQDYARPLKPELIEVYLCAAISETISTVEVPNNIQLNVICSESTLKLKLDMAFLKRIMINLLTNAIQAMPSGGKLTVRGFSKGNKAFITVEDTGVGIPKEAQDKLFTPLFTTKSKGQGFGLVAIKRMTEALGGTISFESQEGKGTKFIIELPIRK